MKKRLTVEQWAECRAVWEQDERTGYAWLVTELDLPVSRAAASKRAIKEGWQKQTTKEVAQVALNSRSATSSATVMGRPTDYRPEYVNIARAMMLLGSTIEQLAEALSVSPRTIYHWQQEHPEFLRTIKDAGQLADARIAEALFHRALGYSHPDEEIKVINDEVVRVPITKHYPPSDASLRYWLNNRAPLDWRNKVEVTAEVEVNNIDTEAMDRLYEKALSEAAYKRDELRGRGNRLGLVLDGDKGQDEIVVDSWDE